MMGDSLTRRQHNYVERAVEAFETAAEALEQIANRFDSSSEATNVSDAEAETHQTKIEPSGRYEELGIEGVPAGSVAIDYGTDPPELIVHAEDVRHPASTDPEMPSHIVELPRRETETQSE